MILHLGGLLIVSVAMIHLIFAKRLLEDSIEVQENIVQDTTVSRTSKTAVAQKVRLYDTFIQLLAVLVFVLGVMTLVQIYNFMFQ